MKDCIKDYGSVYGFWCFSFERFNGILGKFHTNSNDISLQVMRKLVSGSQLRCDKIVDESVFRKIESTTQTCHDMYVLRQAEVVNGFKLEFSCEKRLSLVRQAVLTRDAVREVEDLFKQLYGFSFVCVSSLVKKMTRIEFLGETLAVNKYRSNNSPYSFVMAKIPNVNGVAGSEEEAGVITALYEVSVQRMIEGEVSCVYIILQSVNGSHNMRKSIFMDLIPQLSYGQLKLKVLASYLLNLLQEDM